MSALRGQAACALDADSPMAPRDQRAFEVQLPVHERADPVVLDRR